jgi:hypothetical protein
LLYQPEIYAKRATLITEISSSNSPAPQQAARSKSPQPSHRS